ncbi:MAG: response regulator [Bacteroidetes bacterium]|nr:response regulator [Bacteroidota bacterium]
MLRVLLADADVEFDEAINGEQAIVRYADGPWDLVLMDVRMPVLDGIEATGRIISADGNAHVVAVTDYDDADCRLEARQAGCRALFGKGDLLPLRDYVRQMRPSSRSGSIH